MLGQVLVDPDEEWELEAGSEQQLEAGLEQQLEVGLEQQLEQVLVKLPELVSARAWKLGLVQQVMAEA